MGNKLSNMWNKLFGNKPYRILLVGLDNAGKTTILYKLKLKETMTTIPTIGFNVETINYNKIEFTIFDIGGQDKLRSLWKYYFYGTHAVIFVIDSSDKDRISHAESTDTVEYEMQKLMEADELRNAVFLFLANKQDIKSACTVSDMAERLKLSKLKNRHWYVQGTNAITGDGLYEGLDWLSKTLDKIN